MTKRQATPPLEDGAGRRGACGGCLPGRRSALVRLSGASVAAMVGVALWPETAESLPLTSAEGAPAGPNELAYAVPGEDGVAIDRDGQVILVRFQQRVYAFNLACPHENTALRWKQALGRFQCPRHESQYQPDGAFITGRATRNMDRFALRRAGDKLVVDLNRLYRSDEQPQGWGGAFVGL